MKNSAKTILKKRTLLVLVFLLALLGSPYFGYSGEVAPSPGVIVPINMAFPMLPTQTVIITGPDQKGSSAILVVAGTEVVVGIIRASSGD